MSFAAVSYLASSFSFRSRTNSACSPVAKIPDNCFWHLYPSPTSNLFHCIKICISPYCVWYKYSLGVFDRDLNSISLLDDVGLASILWHCPTTTSDFVDSEVYIHTAVLQTQSICENTFWLKLGLNQLPLLDQGTKNVALGISKVQVFWVWMSWLSLNFSTHLPNPDLNCTSCSQGKSNTNCAVCP